MTLHAIVVPTWGLSMEEGTLVHWYVKPGDSVKPGDAIVEIETTKINNTLEADRGGMIRSVTRAVGETLPCGAMIAVLDDNQATEDEVAAFVKAGLAEATGEVRAPESVASQNTVEIDGRLIRYLEVGAGTQAPIVLIHGFGGDTSNWIRNQTALAKDRRVVAVDLPGHGGSSKTVSDGSIESLGAAISGLISALDIRRLHLVGHSLGGAIAIAATGSIAERIASVTLIAPVGITGYIDDKYISGFVNANRRREMQDVLCKLFADPTLATVGMAEEALKTMRLDGARDALRLIAASAFDGDRQRHTLRAAMGALKAPTLVLWGAQDAIIPAPRDDRTILERLQLIEGAGHMPHVEKSSTVNQLISNHVQACA